MKTIPSYGKIFALGSSGTENALIGDVIIQEKLDGSLFGFGVNEYHQITMRSKGQVFQIPDVDEAIPLVVEKMFFKAGESVFRFREELRKYPGNTFFYAEYMQSPKHNTLKYSKVPKNNLMLFDGMLNGRWMTREELAKAAEAFDIELVPQLWIGDLGVYLRSKNEKGYSSPGDFLKGMTETTISFLGDQEGPILEGVVIKNYSQTILLGGNIFPLFTKFVREAFKELHTVDWKIRQPKDTLKGYIDGFANEARWQKAVIHLREKGQLTNSLKDIAPLMETVSKDVIEEETENIKNNLYKMFIKDITRTSTKGLPEWYKEKLLENLNDGLPAVADGVPLEPVF
jgi:hypothetical protein